MRYYTLDIYSSVNPFQKSIRSHVICFFCLFLFLFFLNLFIYGCVGSSLLCEGSLQPRQVGATPHRGARASHHRGLSLRSTGSRRAGSAAVAHGPSCSAARGILPDQGSNPCPPHRQANSQPLRHQGSPHVICFDLFHTSDYIFDQNELLNPLVIKNAICIIYLQK